MNEENGAIKQSDWFDEVTNNGTGFDIFKINLADADRVERLTDKQTKDLFHYIYARRDAQEIISHLDINPDEADLELQYAIQQGNVAEEILVRANQRLVVYFVNKIILDDDETKADLLQAGNLGLLRAIRRYSILEDKPFSAFASKCIWHSIIEAVYSDRLIRLPVSALKVLKKIHAENMAYQQKNGVSLPDEELSRRLHVSVSYIRRLKMIDNVMLSLNQEFFDNGTMLGEAIPDDTISLEDDVIKREEYSQLRSIVQQSLEPSEQILLDQLYEWYSISKSQTLEEIAKKHETTKQTIFNRKNIILGKLRNLIEFYEREKTPTPHRKTNSQSKTKKLEPINPVMLQRELDMFHRIPKGVENDKYYGYKLFLQKMMRFDNDFVFHKMVEEIHEENSTFRFILKYIMRTRLSEEQSHLLIRLYHLDPNQNVESIEEISAERKLSIKKIIHMNLLSEKLIRHELEQLLRV